MDLLDYSGGRGGKGECSESVEAVVAFRAEGLEFIVDIEGPLGALVCGKEV